MTRNGSAAIFLVIMMVAVVGLGVGGYFLTLKSNEPVPTPIPAVPQPAPIPPTPEPNTQPVPQPQPVPPTTQTKFIFNRDLSFGMQNDADVRELQKRLTAEGCYTGQITGNFDEATREAVKCFERKALHISSVPADGFVGSFVRKLLNEGASVVTIPPSAPPTVRPTTPPPTMTPATAPVVTPPPAPLTKRQIISLDTIDSKLGSVWLTTNDKLDKEVVIARRPIHPTEGDYVKFGDFVIVGRMGGNSLGSTSNNIIEDRRAAIGQQNEYRAFYYEDFDKALSGNFINEISSVFAMPTRTNNLEREGLLFVIPDAYAVPGYLESASEIVDKINIIYSKNTRKRFFLSGVEIYPDTLCGANYKFHDQVCLQSKLEYNKAYYTPGVIPIFYLPYSANISTSNPVSEPIWHIDVSTSRDAYTLNKDNWTEITVLIHELGHTYGLGGPELYFYPEVQDNTQAEPKLSITNFLPDEYRDDPMVGYSGLQGLFGPLSAYIVNNNLDRRDTHEKYLYRGFSDSVKVTVTGSNSNPIDNADIKVFCLKKAGTQLNKTTPDKILKTGPDGIVIYAPVVKSDANCVVEAIKVYKDGYQPAATYTTTLKLQEAKIMNNINQFPVSVMLQP